MAIQGMVHALRRAGQSLRRGGVIVLVQPRRTLRAFIAIRAGRRREPICRLVNPVFEPVISAAEEAIETVIGNGEVELVGRRNPEFRVLLANPNQLDRLLHLGSYPSRFPAGARKQFRELWTSRSPDAQIEVTLSFAVIALRVKRVVLARAQ